MTPGFNDRADEFFEEKSRRVDSLARQIFATVSPHLFHHEFLDEEEAFEIAKRCLALADIFEISSDSSNVTKKYGELHAEAVRMKKKREADNN